MTRIAIIGANGQLGSRLCDILGERALPVTRKDMDLAHDSGIAACLDALAPDAIINAAAYTNVEKAEDEPDEAMRINAYAAASLASWAGAAQKPFIHISTDYVFDGSKGSPYRETDTPHAINAYGISKQAGERDVLNANPEALVARVSWLYDSRGKNFFTTIASKLQGTEPLRIVNDQLGTPCYAPDIAQALVELLDGAMPRGILHLVQQGYTSWYGFACAIRDGLEQEAGRTMAGLIPIAASEYPTRAERPADSRLDASLLYSSTGLRLASWQDATARAVKEYDAY